MKQVLNKFVTTKGVLGAYILTPEKGIFESKMPSKLNKESLLQIGRNLSELTALASSDFSDHEEISFFFDKAALRIQEVDKGYHFIAMFFPHMDRDNLRKASDIFISEFNQALSNPPTLSLVKPSGNGQGRKAGGQSAEDLMSSDALAGPLDIMQSALFKVVGPMAKIVFLDALEQWMTLDTPCMDSLPLLTDIVSEEIGDTDLANGFKGRLPSFCCSSSPNFSSKKSKKDKSNIKVVQNL